MKNILLIALGFLCVNLLNSCAQSPLKNEMFEEVVIRNASGETLTDVRLYAQKGVKEKGIQTSAIYPFSQLSLGFSPKKIKGEGVILSWQQAGTSYSKDLAPYFVPIKDKKEIYVFTVIVGSYGDVQTTAEAVR